VRCCAAALCHLSLFHRPVSLLAMSVCSAQGRRGKERRKPGVGGGEEEGIGREEGARGGVGVNKSDYNMWVPCWWLVWSTKFRDKGDDRCRKIGTRL
jgi:hypothetical protein